MKKNWYISCSPRSPEKIKPELILLEKYEGEYWEGSNGRKTQEKFAQDLILSKNFKGEAYEEEKSFSARDRVAPMKTFGFVYVDNEKKLRITKAGKALISRKNSKEIFLKQFLKWQYPSYQHKSEKQYPISHWKLFPFLFFMKIIEKIGFVTENEIKIFLMTIKNNDELNEVSNLILEFRKKLAEKNSTTEKENFISTYEFNHFKDIYGDISKVREGKTISDNENAVKTKLRNARDMADAVVRYFLYTGIFITNGNKILFNNEKEYLIKEILKLDNFFDNYKNNIEFNNYYGDTNYPKLILDNLEELKVKILETIEKNKKILLKIIHHFTSKYNSELLSSYEDKIKNLKICNDLFELKDILAIEEDIFLNLKKKKLQIKFEDPNEAIEIINNLKKYHLSSKKQKEIFKDYLADKNTLFEYFIFNGMIILGNGIEYQNNFTIDENLFPLRHASGNQADMEIYYEDFITLVEVTTSAGKGQFRMEQEPVTRHYLKKQEELIENKDNRDLYCLFIAPKLNKETFLEFVIYNKNFNTKIIPLTLNQFINILEYKNNHKSKLDLKKHLFNLLKITIDFSVEDYEKVCQSIDKYINKEFNENE